jgi:DNA-binding LacI/PurR family transcriptional regulator
MPYRWQQISESLKTAIEEGKLKPGERLPPDVQLASQYRVSKMTIHRAMGELQQAGLIERKRRLGSVVSARAGIARRRTAPRFRVAMLTFAANDFPQASYLGGFRDALPDDCDLLLCDTGNEPEREIAHLERMRKNADGIACFPSGDPATTKLLTELIAEGIPVLCLDRLPDGLQVDAIVTDNYGSTRAALQFLTERGRRRIAFVTTDNFGISSVRRRRDAYRDTLAAVGGPDPDELTTVLPCIATHDFDAFAEKTYCSLQILFRKAFPDALFCLEDYCLAAALEACERLGVVVGRDIEVVSYSDIPPLTLRGNRQVHRLVQRAREMGQMGAERLLRRMSGEEMATKVIRVEAAFLTARLSLTSSPVLLPT